MNRFALFIAAAGLCLSPAAPHAATLTWDADPSDATATDGSGTWDSASTNWWNGAANTNWSSATPDLAVFGAAGGTGVVTLVESLAVGGLTFNAGYRLEGGALALSGVCTAAANSDAAIVSPMTGAASFVKSGPATLALSGANTFTGPAAVNEGALEIRNAFARTNGGLVIAAGAEVRLYSNLFLQVGSANPSIGVAGAGLLRLAAAASSATAPDLTFAANHSGTTYWGARLAAALDLGAQQRFIHGYTSHNGVGQYGTAAADCQFAGPISGAGGLTFVAQMGDFGSPAMGVPFCLNATNTFTGPVEIQRGSVYLGSDGALTNANVLKFNAAAGNAARFFLWGRGATVADLQSSGAGSALIADGASAAAGAIAPATLTVIASNATTFGGVLADAYTEYGTPAGTFTARLAVVKAGPATLTLTGTNTFAGPLAIADGTLAVGGAGLLGGGAYSAAITNSGRLLLASAAPTQLLGGAISGTGQLVKAGAGLLVLTGDNTFSGGLTVSGGAVRVDNATGSGTGVGNVQLLAGSLLAGRGTIAGTVQAAAGARVAPGADGIGTLTAGGLSFAAGCTAVVEVASDATSNDLLVATGVDGAVLQGCSFALFAAGTSNAWTLPATNVVVLNLVQFSGALGGAGAFGVANPAPGLRYTFQTNGGFLQVVVQPFVEAAWTGAGGDANWSNPTNWAGQVAPTDLSAAVFGAPLRTECTNDLPANTRLSLVFTNGAPSFTLRGQPVNLAGNVVNLSAQPQAIELPLAIDAGRRTVFATGGDVRLGGAIGQTNGAWGLDVQGPGTVFLTASNQYQAAALVLTNAGRLTTDALALNAARTVSLAADCVLTTTNSVLLTAPAAGDTVLAAGPGTWSLRDSGSSLLRPDLYYSPEGLLGNWSVIIGALLDTGATGTTRYIRGNSNRNDFYRYFGDWQQTGGIAGGGGLYFLGVPQGAYEMTFTLRAANTGFTGAVTLQRGDLVLYHPQALGPANDVLLNPAAGENAYLHPWGAGFAIGIGSLASAGAGNARLVGHYTQTFTVNQGADATFAGAIVSENGVFSLVKAGPAALRLTGSNTYNGTTLVRDGALLIGAGGTSGALGTGAVTVDALLSFDRADAVSLPSAVSGTGTLVQAGAGTLTIPAASTVSVGRAWVSNGTLAVNGLLAAPQVDVPAGGTLRGTGVVAATLAAGGIVAPGWAGAGTLALTDSFAPAPAATFRVELTGPGSNTMLQVGQLAFLDGALSAVSTNGYAPAAGDEFVVLTTLATIGGFATTNLPALAPDLGWDVVVGATSVVLRVVPAPASGYAAWAAAIQNGLTNFADAAAGDGYANLLKYATGGSPTNADTLARLRGLRTNDLFAALFNRNTNATDVTLIVEGGSGPLTGVTWTGWATNRLGSWGAATNVLEAATSTPARVIVTDPNPAQSNWLLRLRVTAQ